MYLATEDFDHTRTKTTSPQANGICRRFHKTLLEGFYQVQFTKRICHSTQELQEDLDAFLGKYKLVRSHQVRWRYGKTRCRHFRPPCT